MKARFFASLASLLAFTSTASATVTQPNGLVTPRDPDNGETQLYTLFSQRGEDIDWITDGASTPNTFSPLCGFTATLLLKQTGSSLGLAWYNETGAAPQGADLHTIVPAGSPVGTVISGTDIKGDPAYAGGLVGFALIGGQTHYSNPAWNPGCTTCNPPAPWFTTVIYPSKETPNAFYLGFEDGPMGSAPNNFNNDGDYNDYVFLLTGVTCQGGGQSCDSGQPGICAPGVSECSSTGTTCRQLSQPAAETCNNLDDNCDGKTDEGDLCSAGNVCDKGVCVPKCRAGEFTCQEGTVCSSSGVCVDPKCKDVTCDSGKVCVQGTCQAPCDGVVCPGDQVCRNGACTDPCLGVTCEVGSGKVCDKGVCVLRCDCLGCSEGNTCVTASGLCVESACATVTCNAGTRCVAGTCIDACSGAVCPKGQACTAGACVALPPETPDAGGGGGLTGPGVTPSDDAGSGAPNGTGSPAAPPQAPPVAAASTRARTRTASSPLRASPSERLSSPAGVVRERADRSRL